jgi:hypothetical protein
MPCFWKAPLRKRFEDSFRDSRSHWLSRVMSSFDLGAEGWGIFADGAANVRSRAAPSARIRSLEQIALSTRSLSAIWCRVFPLAVRNAHLRSGQRRGDSHPTANAQRRQTVL